MYNNKRRISKKYFGLNQNRIFGGIAAQNIKKTPFLPFLARFSSESKYETFNFLVFDHFDHVLQGYLKIFGKIEVLKRILFDQKWRFFSLVFNSDHIFFSQIFSLKLSVHVVDLRKQVKNLIEISYQKSNFMTWGILFNW